MQNDVIQLDRLSVKEEYRNLPLNEIERKHLRIAVSPDEDYLLVDGDEEWETKYLPFNILVTDNYKIRNVDISVDTL